MKRSELIVSLNNLLEVRRLDLDNWSDHDYMDAEAVLDFLEEAGMKPPYRDKTEEEREHCPITEMYSKVLKWDEE